VIRKPAEVATRKPAEAPARERLSRERIAQHALALADAEGLDAVTIRRLAQDQGVTPMALYWHFKDKEQLLNGLVERLLSEVRLPAAGPDAGTWDEQLRDLLSALLHVLRAHPAVVGLIQYRIMLSEVGLNLTERALALLHQAGFSAEQAAQLSSHALSSIMVLVTAEPGKAQADEEQAAHEQRMRTKVATLQALSPDRFPRLRASAEGFVHCHSEEYFNLGLDVLITGIRGVSRTQS
jgi:AcrR family transcriptional regulator